MALGEQIAELRKTQKMSQEELACVMQVSRQAVSKWENGITNPDTENLIRLAEIFEVDVNVLICSQSSQRTHAETPIETKTGTPTHKRTIRFLAVMLVLTVCSTILFASLWIAEKHTVHTQTQPTSQWDSVRMYTETPSRKEVSLTATEQQELSSKIWAYYFTQKREDTSYTKVPAGGLYLFVEFTKHDYTHLWCFTTRAIYHHVIMDSGEAWSYEYEPDYHLLTWLKTYME